MESLCSGSQTNAEYIDAEHLTGSTLLRRLFKKRLISIFFNHGNVLPVKPVGSPAAIYRRAELSRPRRPRPGVPRPEVPQAGVQEARVQEARPERREPSSACSENMSRHKSTHQTSPQMENTIILPYPRRGFALLVSRPLDGPPGAPDGGLCTSLLAPRRTSGRASWRPSCGPLYRPPSPQQTYI